MSTLSKILKKSDEQILTEARREKEIEQTFNDAKDAIDDTGVFSDDQCTHLFEMLNSIRRLCYV